MDLGDIKQKIAEDKLKTTSSYRRYPVRFLFMELNNNTQNEIMDLVKNGNGELLELSDYIMKKDDGWLTKSRFMQVIREHASKEKDTYVLGFSEMIRFYSRKEIESTVLSLFDIENTNIMNSKAFSRRIYFICFSMMDSVYNVLQNCFARFNLLDPFINSDYEISGKYKQIYFVSDEYSTNIKENKIKTSVEWIGLWRNSEILDFKKPIWCCSASLYEWHKKASPDNAFQIEVINNTKQYLQKVMKCDIKFDYLESEDTYWKDLLSDFEQGGVGVSIKDVLSRRLGTNIDKMEALAGKLVLSDNMYEKWLIKNYVQAYATESYLCRVLRYSNSNKELCVNIWLQGYKISNLNMLQERRDIIKELNKYASLFTPENEIKNEIIEGVSHSLNVTISLLNAQYGFDFLEISKSNGIPEDEMRTRVGGYVSKTFKPAYTGISRSEKEFLINLYSNGFLGESDIQVMYPSLFSYLYGTGDSLVHGCEEYKMYLREYRKSKVQNSDTSYLANFYNSGYANASQLYELYYGMDKQDIAVEKYRDENTDVYILDGVGAEYFSLIVDLLSRNAYEVECCKYASVHLPSITDVNKTYLSKNTFKRWIVDFDRDVVHGDFYHTTTNLRKAFDVLENVIKEITEDSFGRRVIITSDHGATARARWVDTKKKYDFSQADHEGRCCMVMSKSGYENTDDYIVYEDEITPGKTYLISLNEMSLYNRPKYEDHGGATIEEMIVPVIVAVPARIKSKINYRVLDDKLLISGLDKFVRFIIKPDPEKAILIEEDGTVHELIKDGTVYMTELSSGKVQKITVQIENTMYEFVTENIAVKYMGGDDGFDD